MSEMTSGELYDSFEQKLTETLVGICRSRCMLPDGAMPSSEDIDQKLNGYLREFLEEALPEFDNYPDVVFAWAGYVGMAVARMWDTDWTAGAQAPYAGLHGPRGFDDMDEHITADILGHPLGSKEATDISSLLASCATSTISLIRHQGIESGTEDAFFILVRSIYAMMRVGAAVELSSLGYKFFANFAQNPLKS